MTKNKKYTFSVDADFAIRLIQLGIIIATSVEFFLWQKSIPAGLFVFLGLVLILGNHKDGR